MRLVREAAGAVTERGGTQATPEAHVTAAIDVLEAHRPFGLARWEDDPALDVEIDSALRHPRAAQEQLRREADGPGQP